MVKAYTDKPQEKSKIIKHFKGTKVLQLGDNKEQKVWLVSMGQKMSVLGLAVSLLKPPFIVPKIIN